MTLQSNPPLTLQQIYTEYLAPLGTPLSEFVRGGAWVPDIPSNSGVPTTVPISILDLLGSSRVLEFPQLGLQVQHDTNTRGRTDDEPYEWVGGNLPIATTGTVPVGAVGDGGFFPMEYFNINRTVGDPWWTQLADPPGGYGFFEAGPWTMAIRWRQPDASAFEFGSNMRNGYAINISDYLDPTDSTYNAWVNQGSNNAGDARAEVRNSGGDQTSVQIQDFDLDDAPVEHVTVIRLTVNTPTDITMDVWLDGAQVVGDTSDTKGGPYDFNEVAWGIDFRSGDGGDGGPTLDVFWGAYWDFAISDADMATLVATPNPFV